MQTLYFRLWLRFVLVTLVCYCNCKVLQYKQTALILSKLYRYNRYHEINIMINLSFILIYHSCLNKLLVSTYNSVHAHLLIFLLFFINCSQDHCKSNPLFWGKQQVATYFKKAKSSFLSNTTFWINDLPIQTMSSSSELGVLFCHFPPAILI